MTTPAEATAVRLKTDHGIEVSPSEITEDGLFHARYGHYYGPAFPPECVLDCTTPGQDASEAITYWRGRLGFRVPRELAVRWLEDAWDDLSMADDSTLADRVLWCACCNVMEEAQERLSATENVYDGRTIRDLHKDAAQYFEPWEGMS